MPPVGSPRMPQCSSLAQTRTLQLHGPASSLLSGQLTLPAVWSATATELRRSTLACTAATACCRMSAGAGRTKPGMAGGSRCQGVRRSAARCVKGGPGQDAGGALHGSCSPFERLLHTHQSPCACRTCGRAQGGARSATDDHSAGPNGRKRHGACNYGRHLGARRVRRCNAEQQGGAQRAKLQRAGKALVGDKGMGRGAHRDGGPAHQNSWWWTKA